MCSRYFTSAAGHTTHTFEMACVTQQIARQNYLLVHKLLSNERPHHRVCKRTVREGFCEEESDWSSTCTIDLCWQFLQSIIRSSKEAYICAVLKTLEGQRLHTAGCPKYNDRACLKICSEHYVARRKKTVSPPDASDLA